MTFVEIICVIITVFLVIWCGLIALNVYYTSKDLRLEEQKLKPNTLLLKVMETAEKLKNSGVKGISAVSVVAIYQHFEKSGASDREIEEYFNQVFKNGL